MAANNWNNDDIRPGKVLSPKPSGEEIVISGIAGRFPESDNMHELRDNLMEKRDLVTSDYRRWKLDHPHVPQRTGKINNVEKFDALFFGVHYKQAHSMDPLCRMLMEHAYEAVVDAGINPKQLRGSRTGVFMGACFSESEKTWFYDKLRVNGFGITGCCRAMLSNRVSYYLGVHGPSLTIDTACSSGLSAVEQAYRAINDGLCDAALVGSGNLCLHPYVSMQFSKLGVLSSDGRCKTFDESANGYVRSEAACVIFLQKAKDAKRVYATLVHGKVNCDGFKEHGITFPSSHMQSVLLKEFYLECNVPATLVSYIEAHGTGTRVGDPEEVNAIDKALCENRSMSKPLLIGSVKSNLGHSEPASGLVSIAKLIVAMETGMIPANLHFKQCKSELKGILEGRIKVVSEMTPWQGGYAGVNSFGFGGANAHVLLKSNDKEKIKGGAASDDLPRLVAVSGRTKEAVSQILNDLEKKAVDVEYVALLHNIHSDEMSGHLYRGYTILPPRGIVDSSVKAIQAASGVKRPVWFVFSGMGSQWPGMGEALLRLPVFAEAIKKCDMVLKAYGIDLFGIITNKDKSAFDSILNAFIGNAAIQIGLVDVLFSLGIRPDNIIGHSVGELGCAYADGCFTAEQMILSAYSRGLVSIETKVIHGLMAAVGLGYEQLKDMCPLDIEVACHNSSESATISGPQESMKNFVAELTAKNIFVRQVKSNNIPYHSRYIAAMGPRLLAYMKKLVPHPKARSARWVSTSVPMDKWDSELARYSSAEYHTNNLLNPVLFEESLALIPKDAIAIEIAPHGLLQAILKRSLDPNVVNICLVQRAHSDNVKMLLLAVGKLFNVGLQPRLSNLYPAVKFPVSRSTPMISPLIKWEHSDDWYVTSYASQEKLTSGERVVKISLLDSEYEALAGHVIDGRKLLAATGYLTLIWETLGLMLGKMYTELSVVFEDVKFLRATTLSKDGSIELTLMIHKGSGRFEVVEGDTALVTGLIRLTTRPSEEKSMPDVMQNREEELMMTSQDVYKEMRLRGYQYAGVFRSIARASTSGSRAHIVWQNDWAAFMDNMLQMKIIGLDSRRLFVPTRIKKLVIDANAHHSQIKSGETDKELEVSYDALHDVISCAGVEISGITTNAIARRRVDERPIIEEYKFVPNADGDDMGLAEIARLSSHIAIENQTNVKVKTIELIDEIDKVPVEDFISSWISQSLRDQPLIEADTTIFTTGNCLEHEALPGNISVLSTSKANKAADALLAVGHQLLRDDRMGNLNILLDELKPDGFLLTRENRVEDIEDITRAKGFHIVLMKKHGEEHFVLLRKQRKLQQPAAVIKVTNDRFDWLETMQQAMSKKVDEKVVDQARIYFVAQGDFASGLMGLVNCLRREPGGEFVRGILIQDPKAPPFSFENSLYAEQVQKDLLINVLREHGVWGTYRHLALPPVKPIPVQHAYVKPLVQANLSSLTWMEGSLKHELDDKNLVRIMYASLNFRDVMLASGKLATETVYGTRLTRDCVIGIEFSGLDYSGKRLMGLLPNRGLSNLCIADETLTWEIPERWSFEDAATVPCVYATCLYAFYMKGALKKGEKVLIHAGTGGIGQAAINLALAQGCEVFTTVGTPEKRNFIRERFPQIRDDHIGNSRDTSFLNMIRAQTNGRGVDVVLNSLSDSKLLASVDCLAAGGRFLEIGKYDLAANNPLGMECFMREINFRGVMLDRLFMRSPKEKFELKLLFDKYLKSGVIKPLTRTVFPSDQVEAAFRLMAAGKHLGKVLIKVHEQETDAAYSWPTAMPQHYCLGNRSYIILGGLGGFGLELADWLVLRGAKHLVLTSRTGLKNGYQRMRVDLWRSYGVKVIIVSGKDASSSQDCRHIIEMASKLAPIDGVFNLAVVLRDALWQNQTAESFETSFGPKARATQNLDALTRELCPELRFFVVFSSASCGRGNVGQTNYGMSNSVMERICEQRVAEGLPALAIQWGAIGEVGLVADMQQDAKELAIAGTLQQSLSSCLRELDGFLHRKGQPIVSSMLVAVSRAVESSGGDDELNLVEAILAIMGLRDLRGISLSAKFAEIGMDSMMAVEIKQTLERNYEIFLNAQDIRNLTFAKLQEMLCERKPDKAPDAEGQSAGMDSLTDLKMLIRAVRNIEETRQDTYLTLQTKEETGRDEMFLIPGIEGLSYVYENLSPRLKAPVTCLQLGKNNQFDAIADMASFFLPHVLEKCCKKSSFTLVGYSFGALIAIELARQLEDKKLNGRLILIDGAPEQVRAIITHGMTYTTVEDLENQTLALVAQMIASADNAKIAVDIKNSRNWNEKLDIFLGSFTASSLGLNDKETKDYCTSIHKRMLAAVNYDPAQSRPIRCPITLIRPTSQSFKTTSEDYGLSSLTNGHLDVHYATGDHATILENNKVASIINDIN